MYILLSRKTKTADTSFNKDVSAVIFDIYAAVIPRKQLQQQADPLF